MTTWLLIEGGTVIDGTGAPASPDTPVLIKDDRIVALGSAATREVVPRGESLEVLSVAGQTVMPGLIDVHCHVSFGESRAQEEQDLYTSVETRTLRSAWNVKKMLRAGVTSISNPGGSHNIGVAIRDAIGDGLIEGPRMTSAGRFLSTSNGLGALYPTWIGVPDSSIGVLTNTLDEMRTEVRRQVKDGVDFIKVSDSPLGDFQAFLYEELRAITELAHQMGRRVTIHARGSEELRAAVRAEMDWIMHGNFMTDQAVEELAASGIPLVPTLLLQLNVSEWGHLVGVSAPRLERAKRMLDHSYETMQRAHAAGVKFMLGTDTGFAVTPYGEWHGRELQALVEVCGLSPLEAIQAGTQNGALAVNRVGELGEITVGAIADVIVIAGDPLRDIRILQHRERISHVIKGGRRLVFDDDEMATRRPFNRAMTQALGDLTQDLVFGRDTEPEVVDDDVLLAGPDADDLARELMVRNAAGQHMESP
jgi:imidazolonepropionase-like amidohydrolase